MSCSIFPNAGSCCPVPPGLFEWPTSCYGAGILADQTIP